jgi:pyrroline-5-carboxylate reductase
MTDTNDAVAAAYRTINEADSETATQLKRLRGLYKHVGEDSEVGESAIDGIMGSGPGAATRLRATADAVARLHGIEED